LLAVSILGVITLDISLHGTNGIELIRLMRAEQPHLPILVISMHDETIFGLRAMKAGALGSELLISGNGGVRVSEGK
jgi:DNA-binding NarL/FixJ family response regulator